MTQAPSIYQKISKDLHELADPTRAKNSSWFFKTKPGQYGYGDLFLGLTNPQIRTLAKKYRSAPLEDIELLLKSSFHEERFLGLAILVLQYKKSPEAQKDTIAQFYIRHKDRINNWDLVDCSAPHILGEFLVRHNDKKHMLMPLAQSTSLWDRRIAVLSTFAYISRGDSDESIQLAILLMHDSEDLMHKAVGWMLREIYKRNANTIYQFLDTFATKLPRTSLRYAIERMPENTRKKYLLMR